MKLARTLPLVAALGFCMSGPADAALTQNGNGTFTDTATGYTWQNISTFWGVDTSVMSGLLLPGFHFASLSEVTTLEADAPAIPANFFSDATAMGVPLPTPEGRNLIWGVYGDLTNWTWKSDVDTTWKFNPTNGVTVFQDLGAFAVSVPEPETYAMLIAGLGLMGAVARRRKIKQ